MNKGPEIVGEIERVLLSREDRYSYSIMLDNNTLRLFSDYIPNKLATEIRVVFSPFSETLVEEEVSYPSSFWQHFKQDVFPEWLLERFPVKNKIVVVKVKAAYPYVSLPQEKHWFFKTTRNYDELAGD